LIGGAAALGLVVGALAWISVGRGDAQTASLEASLALAREAPKSLRASGADAPASSRPLTIFDRTAASATPEITVVLQGLARTSRRHAALLAIGGKAADWLTVGETRDGVTLEAITAAGATVSTASGLRDIGFGPSSPVTPQQDGGPPPGFRSPPPPASAPPGAGG
jgi:hypothetical protein